ncbi:MAG TPA: GGDEF domain-containing protein [Xanthomonadaceae bacterium]|jgi:diguanylate cyclase (GGDEF)-like protein|nr:GGDEF domain-containing protein [Xanthomonadaceae bacterium]
MLLVVLQVVSLMLTMLMFVAARQARHRDGLWLWVVAFGISAISQFLREWVSAVWGHQAGLPFGHLGGPLAYALLYLGIQRYLGTRPRVGFAISALLVASVLSVMAVSQGMNYSSLAMTGCVSSLFQAMTAVAFWRIWRSHGGPARLGAAGTFAVSAIASLGRAVTLTPIWPLTSDLTQTNEMWLLSFIALDIVQVGSLLFLLNQSLLDELQNVADHDALTGLLNRGGLTRRLKRQRPRLGATGSARMGVLCMDLDHFKAINDEYGHGAGDDVLTCMGQMLRENSRPRDLPVRQGGEEFEMIVDAGSEEELCALAERLRDAVERAHFQTRVGPIAVTVSIGAALARNPVESLDDLGERADQSLLAAKRAGRNCVVLASTPQRA